MCLDEDLPSLQKSVNLLTYAPNGSIPSMEYNSHICLSLRG